MAVCMVNQIPINFRLMQMIKEAADKKGQNVQNFIGDLVIEGYIIYRQREKGDKK